jgi:hypothetical protein
MQKGLTKMRREYFVRTKDLLNVLDIVGPFSRCRKIARDLYVLMLEECDAAKAGTLIWEKTK